MTTTSSSMQSPPLTHRLTILPSSMNGGCERLVFTGHRAPAVVGEFQVESPFPPPIPHMFWRSALQLTPFAGHVIHKSCCQLLGENSQITRPQSAPTTLKLYQEPPPVVHGICL
jgi:hypothetical protein